MYVPEKKSLENPVKLLFCTESCCHERNKKRSRVKSEWKVHDCKVSGVVLIIVCYHQHELDINESTNLRSPGSWFVSSKKTWQWRNTFNYRGQHQSVLERELATRLGSSEANYHENDWRYFTVNHAENLPPTASRILCGWSAVAKWSTRSVIKCQWVIEDDDWNTQTTNSGDSL